MLESSTPWQSYSSSEQCPSASLGGERDPDNVPTVPDTSLLERAARISTEVQACVDDDPGNSEHLIVAYDDYLLRNPSIAAWLDGRHNAATTPKQRRTYDRHRQEFEAALAQERRQQPEVLAERCNEFTKDLDEGRLDYVTPGAQVQQR